MAFSVLLINANRYTRPYAVYPLGMCHVAAALAQAGHRVTVADMNRDREALEKTIETAAPDFVGLSLRNIDDVDINSGAFFVPEIVEITETVKRLTGAPVVLGGSAYSLFPRELLALSGADYGIAGEGEDAFCAFLDAAGHHLPYAGIPGLVYRENNMIIVNNRGPGHCRRIPLSDHRKELVEFYVRHSSILNVQTQRGCGHHCCYCTYPLIEGCELRYRDPQDVAEEVARARSLGAHYFFIVDSVFNTSANHAGRICDEFIRRKLDIAWGCFLRPQGLTRELMALMKRAGLRHIEFGTDSFCDSVLDSYGKGFTFPEIAQSSALARACGVHYAHFLIAGGPGETGQTMLEGYENSRHLKRTVIFPFIGMRIYPGTPLARRALSEGVIRPEDDLLTPVFYISPALEKEIVARHLERFKQTSHNWVFGRIEEDTVRIMNGLRKAGVEGPLWEFLVQ